VAMIDCFTHPTRNPDNVVKTMWKRKSIFFQTSSCAISKNFHTEDVKIAGRKKTIEMETLHV